MSRLASCVGSLCFLLTAAPTSWAFLPMAERSLPLRHMGSSSSSSLFSSSTLPSPQQISSEQNLSLISTPAVVHGRPLGETHKKLNRFIVHMVKSMVFDTFYPPGPASTLSAVSVLPRALVVQEEEAEEVIMMRCFKHFYALETIARMPYFSFLSVLHLWETLGLWKQAEYLKVHFAESWNESHHRLIMEELVGPEMEWMDEFLSQHVAAFYYWIVIALYMFNPAAAYNLNQAVEEEAFETYNNFLQQHEATLKASPAPSVAVKYYTGSDQYLFHAMHWSGGDVSSASAEPPRKQLKCDTLYDTFLNVRNDEMEHVKTMVYLQQDVCENYHLQNHGQSKAPFFFGSYHATHNK